jgi:hypothetical protein
MIHLRVIVSGEKPLHFVARLEEETAPQTCAAFKGMLPFRGQYVHCRWSGEAVWIPLK